MSSPKVPFFSLIKVRGIYRKNTDAVRMPKIPDFELLDVGCQGQKSLGKNTKRADTTLFVEFVRNFFGHGVTVDGCNLLTKRMQV